MPIFEITDCNGNTHSVDLSKTPIKTIDDLKAEFKKFDEKKKSSRPTLRETQAMQSRNRGGY